MVVALAWQNQHLWLNHMNRTYVICKRLIITIAFIMRYLSIYHIIWSPADFVRLPTVYNWAANYIEQSIILMVDLFEQWETE